MMTPSHYKLSHTVILFIILLLSHCSKCRNPIQPLFKQPSTDNKEKQEQKKEKEAEKEEEQKPEKPVKNKGIYNLGTTCYMNSVIQILASFYQKPFAKQEGILAQNANSVIKAITGQEEVSPAEIERRARKFFDTLAKPETDGGIGWIPQCTSQEDAAELLVKIFGRLEMPKAKTESTLINPITGAKRKSGEESWSILNINLPEDQPNLQTMQDFFNNSLAPATIKDFNWQENDPHTKVDVQKVPLLQDLDKVSNKTLVINLIRHKYDKDQKQAFKLKTYIENPFNLTIRKEQTTDSAQDLHYQLAGFITHDGGVGGGHYIAYTKVDDKWICYSDTSVGEISEIGAESAAQQAYLFFYHPV